MSIVEEEIDESAYWFELLVEAGIVQQPKLSALIKECDEITAIIVASIKTARQSRNSERVMRKANT